MATPFRKGREGNDTVKLDDLRKVHQQANYTNTIVRTITTQLNHVSLRIEATKQPSTITMPSTMPSTSYTDQISKLFFKTDSIPKANKDSFSEAFSNAQFLKIISNQIQELTTLKDKFVSRLDKTC